jgi:acetolactate synthase-1/2/3 large subunit
MHIACCRSAIGVLRRSGAVSPHFFSARLSTRPGAGPADPAAPIPTSVAPRPPPNPASYVGLTGAEIVHTMLREHGVEVVFGYPGGAILAVYDAIHESPHFKFVLPRREDGGGHMAEGFARVTGKPGVLLVTSGPGATNIVTPMLDALMDGTPLVAITGQVATSAIGTDAFQEADVVGIMRPVSKWCVLVKDVRDLPRSINEAFAIAMAGRPGPVLVDLPKDVSSAVLMEVPDVAPRIAKRMAAKSAIQSERDGLNPVLLARIVELINGAERPIIYAGQGIITAGASEELRALACAGNIPVTTTLLGMGAFDECDPRSLLMLGMHGSATANYAMQEADLIIALGARFDDRVTGALSKFAPAAAAAAARGEGGILHFDIAPKSMNKTVKATELVLGDVRESLLAVLPRVAYGERAPWWAKIKAWKSAHPFAYDPPRNNGALKPQRVIEELYRQLDAAGRVGDAVITTGVGQHQMWAAQYYRWRTPRSLVTSGGSGTMGFGLPSAIGVKIAQPSKIVVDIDGDGSFLMTGLELVTAVEYRVGVKVLLINNNFQGMVRQWQDLFYKGRYSGTPMKNPDFALLAEGMGARGMTVTDEASLAETMRAFLFDVPEGVPVLLNAVCEHDEHVYPMVPAGHGLDEMVLARKALPGGPRASSGGCTTRV